MIDRGRGAYIEPEDIPRLAKPELKLLKLMMANPVKGQSRRGWAEIMEIKDTQVVSMHLSRLKGVDLIKSAQDSSNHTDDEIEMLKELGVTNFYWIGAIGQPIRLRAQHVIDANGVMREIIGNQYNFGLPFWPSRPEKIVTIKGMITEVTSHRIILDFNTTQEKLTKLSELGNQKEVMINIESM